MTTVRQIERGWKAQHYHRLFREITAVRPEASLQMTSAGGWATAAAAIAIIRLDELGQSQAPICATLIRALLTAQEADGGWGDLTITALGVRALLCGQGNGVAVNRGIIYLANLQKSEGVWPNIPLRRMPEDAAISALVLYELGDQPAFHAAVRVSDALEWFSLNESSLDKECQALWHRAERRCKMQELMSKQANGMAA